MNQWLSNMANSTPTEVLTALLVVITGFYAWVTFRMLKVNKLVVQAMREARDAEVRPYVTINVFHIPKNPVFYLRIANTGRTGATNLRLVLDRDFFQYGQQNQPNLKNSVAFQQPIEQLPPGAELVFGLAQGFVVLNAANQHLTPPVFSVQATYSFGSQTFSETTTIDLRPYRDGMVPAHAEAEELKKVREELEKIVKLMSAGGTGSVD